MPANLTALLSLLILDPALRKRRYQAALLLFAAIVGLGAIPGVRAEIGHYASGIVLHTLGYAAITFLLFTGSNGTPGARALRSVLTVLLMGAVDEFIQSFLPYRRGAFVDWLVDANAACICAGLLWAFLPEPSPQR
jgi:VanZ family protein